MLKNYLLIAWRQLAKHKAYAAINAVGLVIGLAVFVFGMLLTGYERNHDSHWANAERIYTIGSALGPKANIGFTQTSGIYTAFGPFIEEELDDGIDAVARTVGVEYLLSHEDDHFYEFVRFADPALLDIFDFDYLEGDARALDDPNGMLITRGLAEKFFGTEPALGRTITLDHQLGLRVAAVIEELPVNTHFVSQLIGEDEFTVLAPLAALNAVSGYDLAGNFNNLSSMDLTYVLLGEDRDAAWLADSLDGVFQRHYPEPEREFISGFAVRPIGAANTFIWDAVNLPVLDSIRLLAFLVLVVAIVNYTNLATAQSLGRGREIGLRKTMGASRGQLVTQFLVESLLIAGIAMLVALALLELSLPLFNGATGRELSMSYATTLPGLLLTTVAVGLVAGAYPALLITRASPIEALRDSGAKGHKGARFRSAMLVLQFTISIFMLAMVMVTYFQNLKLEASSNIYPKSQIITLERLGVGSIQQRLTTLRTELEQVPGVESVSFSSMVPYVQSNSSFDATREAGDESGAFMLKQVIIDEGFLETYEIPMLHGRALDRQRSADVVRDGVLSANVIVNELALDKLGFSSPEAALGEVFYDVVESRAPRAYTIVGVFPDQNFQGFHNEIKATVFLQLPQNEPDGGVDAYRYASIRVQGAGMADALERVRSVWDQVIDDYPMQSEFLEDTFGTTYKVYMGLAVVFGAFAVIALTLSLVGLFGLAAFMAGTRTKEIGIRKVMGASMGQIVRLLVWQFSRPVLWALLIALPLAYFASSSYLSFFADRIEMPAGIVGFAGIVAVFIAWSIVAVHAVRIAAASPIRALRYE